jgi:hypothetical protein
MFLDQRSEAIQSFSHVGVAERQVHPHACRNDDHDAFSLLASCRFTSAGLLSAGAKTRRTSPTSIAIMPSGGSTRSRKTASAGSSFAAPAASATVYQLRSLSSAQAEVDPPAEDHAHGDAMAAANLRLADAGVCS